MHAPESTDPRAMSSVRVVQTASAKAEVLSAIVKAVPINVVDMNSWRGIRNKAVHTASVTLAINAYASGGIPRRPFTSTISNPAIPSDKLKIIVVHQGNHAVRERNFSHGLESNRETEGEAPGRAGSSNPGAVSGAIREDQGAGRRAGHLRNSRASSFVSIGSVAKEIVRKIVEGRG